MLSKSIPIKGSMAKILKKVTANKNLNRHNCLHPLQPQYHKNEKSLKQNIKRSRASVAIRTAF